MSQELLYTSAPHGLKPGSRGFCTVLSTQGMPAPLATGLEALSGYRPVFPSSDSRAHLNPVVRSHVILPMAGRSWHVLTRIADYGLDYSQRTNKLAHHVVLDPGELTESGPAHLIASPAFMRTEWDEEAKLVPPKAVKKTPAPHIGVCRAWKELTGDAGWAGVLAESFLREPERPIFLLYEPGQDLLPLIAESIALLPPERRWDVTFSTYFTGLPQGVTCAWRCLLNGSAEANQSLRFPKALRIDLTGDSIGTASGGHLVEAARDGIPARFESQKNSAQPNSPAPGASTIENGSPRGNSADATEDSNTKAAPSQPPLLSGNVFKPYELADNSNNPVPPRRRTLADVNKDLSNGRHSIRLIFAAVFAVLLVVSVGVGLFWTTISLRRNKPPFPFDAAIAKNETPQTNETRSSPPESPHSKVADVKQPDLLPTEPLAVTTVQPAEKGQDRTEVSTFPSTNKPGALPDDKSKTTMPTETTADAPRISPNTESQAKKLTANTRCSIDTRWKKTTDLHTTNSKSDPYAQLVLWAPHEMHLDLEAKTNKGKLDIFSIYSVKEQSSGPQLATIESIKGRLGEKNDLPEFTLRLTNIAAEPKVKRLNWCELEISGMLATTIRFHELPLPLSKLETKLSGSTKHFGQYRLTWPLGAEISESNIPIIRVEHLSMMFGEVEFPFDTASAKYTKTPALSSILSVQCEKLDAYLKKDLTENASNLLDPIVLKIEPLLAKKDENGSGQLSITLLLSGWDKSIDKFKSQQKADLNAVITSVNIKLPPNMAPHVLRAPSPKLDMASQANKVLLDIEMLKARVDKNVNEKKDQPQPELDGAFAKAKSDLKSLISDYTKLATYNERFGNCMIKTASLYYDVISSVGSQIKRIAIINDAQ